jgi:hypothetical protein
VGIKKKVSGENKCIIGERVIAVNGLKMYRECDGNTDRH